jgi:hypothetical protein
VTAPQLALAAAVAALAGWICLSIVWSTVPWSSVREAERALLFVAAAVACVTFVRLRQLEALVVGLFVAIFVMCAYGLSSRLFPDRIGVYEPLGVYRLAEPVGYWNGLALLSALGVLLGLGLAARASRLGGRAAAAGCLPILVTTMYFTFGRSAWISLGLALALALALDPRRLQLATVLITAAPAAAAALLLASDARGLTHKGLPLQVAVHDGRHLAWILLLLSGCAAAFEAQRSFVESRMVFARVPRLVFATACALVVVTAAAAGVVHAGGPSELVQKARRAFVAPPPQPRADLNQRLLSFSGNGRAALWRQAWQLYRAHPALGAGAGTYERYWLRHRPSALKVRDAHNLYLETLAELGPMGLMLLAVIVALPLAAAVRARRHPLVPFMTAAFVAYAIHAAADWDWEITALTVVFLVLGSGILAASATTRRRTVGPAARVTIVVAVTCLAVLASASLAGNSALAEADDALAVGSWRDAERAADRARRWMPWSPEPWSLRGEAELGAGAVAAARGSFRHEVEKDRGNWVAWYDLGRATSGGERDRAFRRAALLNPRSPEVADARSTAGAAK